MHFWWENAGELKITKLTLFWQLHAYNQLLNLLQSVTLFYLSQLISWIGFCSLSKSHHVNSYIIFNPMQPIWCDKKPSRNHTVFNGPVKPGLCEVLRLCNGCGTWRALGMAKTVTRVP